jgi:hypothetical protein
MSGITDNLDATFFSDEKLDELLSTNDSIFADLGFDLLDLNNNPASAQNGEKRDPLRVGDRLRDFKDAVIDLAIAEHWEFKSPFGSGIHSRVHHQKIKFTFANVYSFKICLAHYE